MLKCLTIVFVYILRRTNNFQIVCFINMSFTYTINLCFDIVRNKYDIIAVFL